MNPTIYRAPSTPQGTFGKFIIDDDHYVTVERPKDGDHPCIPAGDYDLEWFNSPHNGWCYLFKHVEGRTMIEMHRANKASELRGCIAPGMEFGELDGVPAVLGSATALEKIHETLGDSFTLTIKDFI